MDVALCADITMLHVLHTVSGRNWGGLEHRVVKQAEWLRQRGFGATIATPVGGATWLQALAIGLDVINLPFDGLSSTAATFALRRLVRQKRISVIDCHSNLDSKAALGCRDLAGIVRSVHVTPKAGHGMFRRLKWRYGFDQVVCTASSIFGNLQSDRLLLPDRSTIIGEWAEADFFDVPSLKDTENSDIVDVAMVAMLRPDKAPDLALDAFELLRRRSVRTRLTIAGLATAEHEAYAQCLRSRVTQTELKQLVQFIGHCENIPDLLSGLQIVIIPSRREAQSRIAAQAMAAGRPVIASDVGGLSELVKSGATGRLMPPNDAQALAQNIEELVCNAPLRKAFGSAGRMFAEKNLRMEDKMLLTLRVYNRALSKFGKAHSGSGELSSASISSTGRKSLARHQASRSMLTLWVKLTSDKSHRRDMLPVNGLAYSKSIS